MNHVYIVCAVFVLLLSSFMSYGQKRIKRASLSTSLVNAHNINRGTHKVQHSIGQMGVMGVMKHNNNLVLRGFLLPQTGKTETPATKIGVLIYPIPFDTHINIDFDSEVSGDMKVLLHDANGKLLVERQQKAFQKQRLELGDLAQAQYTITIMVMENIFSQSILNYTSPIKETKEIK